MSKFTTGFQKDANWFNAVSLQIKNKQILKTHCNINKLNSFKYDLPKASAILT